MSEYQIASDLDPSDWKAFRTFAHELMDSMLERLERAGEGPVWRSTPDEIKARLSSPAPSEPTPLDGLLLISTEI